VHFGEIDVAATEVTLTVEHPADDPLTLPARSLGEPFAEYLVSITDAPDGKIAIDECLSQRPDEDSPWTVEHWHTLR